MAQAAHLMKELQDFDLREAKTRLVKGRFDLRELGYVPFRVDYLVSEFHLPCSFFVPVLVEGEEVPTFVKVLDRDQLFSEDWRLRLREEGIDTVYAEEMDLVSIDHYFEDAVSSVLDDPFASALEKTRVLHAHGEFIAQRIFRHLDDGDLFETGNRWAGSVVHFFLKEQARASLVYRLFSKNYQTFSHSVQVSLLIMSFCRAMRWRAEDIKDIGVAALYHDVGKAWLEPRILNKPGALTREEFSQIKQHPLLAYEHLKTLEWMNDNQLAAVVAHHESMDGTGYPHGVKGKEIHPYARVVHIVDCFDALTTDRPYKRRTSPYKALKLMQSEMRLSFDHHLLYKFIQFLGS